MRRPGIFLLVLLVAHSASFGHSLSLPKHWLSYFQWLEKFFKANPLVCLPQVIHPNVMLLSQNEQGKSFISLLPSLPPVIIWRPCQQFPGLFTTKELLCPTCNHRLYEGQWNTGHSSYQPRIIHDIDTVVVLICITYRCSNGHKILSYDPRIHAMPWITLIPCDCVRSMFVSAKSSPKLNLTLVTGTRPSFRAINKSFIIHLQHYSCSPS